jgi:cation transport regulator ChaB
LRFPGFFSLKEACERRDEAGDRLVNGAVKKAWKAVERE